MIMRDALNEIEGLTGCKVDAYMSAIHLAPDLFVLDRPVPGEPPSAVDT